MPTLGNTSNNVCQFGFSCIKEWQRRMAIVTMLLIFVNPLLDPCIANPYN